MWTLCENKLPDKDGVYIIKGKVFLSQGEQPIPFVDAAEFLSWRSFPWLPVTDTEGIYDYEIEAWMPLPPYKSL